MELAEHGDWEHGTPVAWHQMTRLHSHLSLVAPADQGQSQSSAALDLEGGASLVLAGFQACVAVGDWVEPTSSFFARKTQRLVNVCR
jgi:hypothetical protein